ncbi:hypothetical protein Z951_45245 [Streptomyces sp. PRh5]|uniref:hypothetical protein n=1 Tax=Streptomyces sp. PRh5 TaxID=1158056 RepID=UPI0004534FBD|nr:hypothetical protein [Streptomyces sp. PRh5]EXU61790.1 hypothetical protein Z951_45245 [Streptomyces sp. PRh5]
MAASPHPESVQLVPTADPHTVCLALVGDLDHEIADDVIQRVQRVLRECEDVHHLRLDCRELELITSPGKGGRNR